MTRILALILLISAALPAPPAQARDLGTALELMRSEKWDRAAREAGAQRSVARDVIEWHRLRAGLGSAGDVMAFLQRRPDWPGLAYLRRQNEDVIAATGRETILAY